MIRIEDLNRPYKTKDGKTAYKATIYKPSDDYRELEKMHDFGTYKHDIIPCGKCIGCRLEYSREWANRGYLESKLWEQNYFVTLTYDEEHLPMMEEVEDENGFTYTNDGEWKGTLKPKDLHDFMHDLRQHMKREYKQDGIRFMACGEYGEEGERPHYHLILFNLNLPTETFFEPRIINKNTYFRNTIIEKCWKKGISNISEADWNNIAYTARYITKKINGKESSEHYAMMGQEKEFFRVSRMPGIGEGYYQQHKEEIYARDEIIIKNTTGTIATKPPKYFDKLYEEEEPEKFKKIKEKRKRLAKRSEIFKDETFSTGRLEHLEIEERTKEEKTQKLIRAIEKKTR